VARLAGDGADVVVEVPGERSRHAVRCGAVAFAALHAALNRRRTQGHPGDPVPGGGVAFLTAHVQGAHVDVKLGLRIGHDGLQVPVLGVGGAAAVEVTGAASLPRRTPHLPRHGRQVHACRRQAGIERVFPVGAGGIVADEAVDVGRVAEIEVLALLAVADVAGGALLHVGRDGDAVVVHHQGEADVLAVLVAGQRGREALPAPVGGAQQILAHLRMAAQAGAGHVLRGGRGAEADQPPVVRRPRMVAVVAAGGRGGRLELALVAADALAVVRPLEPDARRVVRLAGLGVAAGAALGRPVGHVVVAVGARTAQADFHHGVEGLEVLAHAIIFTHGVPVVAHPAIAAGDLVVDPVGESHRLVVVNSRVQGGAVQQVEIFVGRRAMRISRRCGHRGRLRPGRLDPLDLGHRPDSGADGLLVHHAV